MGAMEKILGKLVILGFLDEERVLALLDVASVRELVEVLAATWVTSSVLAWAHSLEGVLEATSAEASAAAKAAAWAHLLEGALEAMSAEASAAAKAAA
jgi:hypothetical protein